MDEDYFAHDAPYSDSKDLAKRTQSDRVLKDKAYEIADNPKYDGYQRGLAIMVYKLFDKKSKGSRIKNESMENYGVTITNVFQSILDKSKRKPNKMWVGQGSEFYNIHLKKWLKDNDIKMCSTHNERKSVVAEGFIKTLKNRISKHMAAVSKYVYYDALDYIVDKYNNT